jgi:hypothetical protein
MRGFRCLIGRHDWSVVPTDTAGSTDYRRECSRCGAPLAVNTYRANDAGLPGTAMGGGDMGGGGGI